MLAKPFSQYQEDASWKLAAPFGQALALSLWLDLRWLALCLETKSCTQCRQETCPFGHPRQVSTQGQLAATCGNSSRSDSMTRNRRPEGFSLKISGSGFNLHRFYIYMYSLTNSALLLRSNYASEHRGRTTGFFSCWFSVSGAIMGLFLAEPVWNENWKVLEEKADRN